MHPLRALLGRAPLPAAVALALAVSSVCVLAADKTAYLVQDLVSNGNAHTANVDPNMLNTWGVSFNPVGLVWVTNNRSGTSTLYDGLGVVNPLVVKVPPAAPTGIGSPTGIVFSGTSDFVVSNGGISGPSRFIFASDDGLISGWAPNVDLLNATRVVTTRGADYTGLAIADSPTGARLYAADFRGGRVDMFDSMFRPVQLPGAFVDPTLPRKLAPFGIQTINNLVYATSAKRDGNSNRPAALDAGARSVDGSAARHGASSAGDADSVIDIFDSNGRFIRRAVSNKDLKQPWGLALAPADFGKYSNRLLVGDFHDGTITAYDQNTGALLGTLNDANGKELKIPGLWGFQFGNGVFNQATNALFFGAGPNGQGGGVYGSVTAITAR